MITVYVTKEDIKKGIPEETDSCAIARAVKRHTRKVVDVDGEAVTINGKVYTASNQKQFEKFIENFDSRYRRHYCRPFKLVLKKRGV